MEFGKAIGLVSVANGHGMHKRSVSDVDRG